MRYSEEALRDRRLGGPGMEQARDVDVRTRSGRLVQARQLPPPAARPRREDPAPVLRQWPRPRFMVGWYDPIQLIRTGIQVAISGIFGRHSDSRLIEAVSDAAADYHDYSEHTGRFVLDYVADIGDGWQSTFAVARAVAALSSGPVEGLPCSNRPGQVLVFGGDEVYPLASKANYDARSELPYQIALAELGDRRPDLFAIPGNHDWYDSLVAFHRRFCGGKDFAGCATAQRRSYFALRLPHDWWLMGTDLQLGSEIDNEQLEYFETVMAEARRLAGPEREPNVILCHAEPLWMYREKYGRLDPAYAESNLRELEEHVFQGSVRLFLAGDQHHYLRYAPARTPRATLRPTVALFPALGWLARKLLAARSLDRGEPSTTATMITSGGGGAFLHPTHDKPTALAGGLELAKAWPSRAASLWLTFANVAFPVFNPLFGLVTGVLYLLTCASVRPGLPGRGAAMGDATYRMLLTLVETPSAMFWIAAVLTSFLLFTDTRSRAFRVLGGLTHGAAHLVAAFALGWAAASVCADRVHDPLLRRLAEDGLVFVGGAITGSFIMGFYLLLSLVLFGRHANEAFSSLRIEGYKNFLRLEIDEAGDLLVHPIGIHAAPATRGLARRLLRRPRTVPAAKDLGPPPRLEAIEPALRFVRGARK
jgi:hypothetical protein